MGGWGGVGAGLLLMASAASGCAKEVRVWDGPTPGDWGPTLLVESAAVDHIAVRVNGLRVGTIVRGRSCVRLPVVSGRLVLDFVALGSSARLAEPIQLSPGRHWRLAIGPTGRLDHDLLSLTPVERGC